MLETLNEHQKEAVLYNDGPLAVIASAGSGKTHSVTTKIQYLVEVMKVRPNRIWAFTFTNKAAEEMGERLEEMVGDDASKLKLSTIHKMAYKILKSCRLASNPTYKMPKPMANTGPVLMHLFAFLKNGNYKTNDAKLMLANISGLKMNLITTKNFKQHVPYNEMKDPKRMDDAQVMHEFYKAYQKFLRTKGYMDFTDMLVDCYYELIDPKNSPFVERLQDKCEYVILDETQDTNAIAYKLVKILAKKHNRLFVFGDLRQAIYSFQGADDELTRDFISQYKAKVIDLPINYRSTKTIVESANKLISYQKNVIGVPATTPNEVGDPISFHTHENLGGEAYYIADLIEGLVSSGDYEYRDITILYRVHSQAVQIVNQFMAVNIPHIQFVKTSFFLRKEMKDVITYLKIARDYDKIPLKDIKSIIHKPSRYVSNVALNAVEEYMDDNDATVREALDNVWSLNINSMQSTNLSKAHNQFTTLTRMYKGGSDIKEMIQYICKDSGVGYENWAINDKIEREPDADISMDFDALMGTANEFGTVDEFLEYIDGQIRESRKVKDESANAIKLMSVHRSKGMGFPVVIIAGLTDRTYPFHMAVNEGNSDEERRVMYVALTRAKKKIYLSAIDGRMGRLKVRPSPYLDQMNINYTGNNSYDGFSRASGSTQANFFKDLQEGLKENQEESTI